MNDAIELVQVPELEAEDIHLGGDRENKVESAPAILHQNNHKAKDLDTNVNVNKAEAKDNDFAWDENQYPTPDLLFFKAFLANSVGLSVQNADSFKFEEVDHSHEKLFVPITAKKRSKYYSLKLAVIT